MIDYELSPMDIDYDDPNDEPVCVCPDYVGATHPVFCRACNMWTDDAELLAENNAPEEIPAPALIETPVYVFTDPMFTTQEEAA